MKLAPAKIGATPKQLGILGGLLALAVVRYVLNRNPSSPEPVTPQRAAPAAAPAVVRSPVVKRGQSRAAANRGEEFRPTLKLPDGMDVSKIDPTIRLDLLARVHNVGMELGPRGSVFAFGQPPPPPTPKVDPIKLAEMAKAAQQQKPPEPAKPVEPPKPTAPPVPLKFYGYSNAQKGGPKRAFFLDGEDIVVVKEDDVVKNRYKIIKIGVNSVVVEDMNFKTQQTLPLVEELAG